MASRPALAPVKVRFMFGSILSQGDHSPHRWKSFTIANAMSAGAWIVAERCTENSDGRVEMMPASATTATARPMRIFLIMGGSLYGSGLWSRGGVIWEVPGCAQARGPMRLPD